MPTPSQFFLNTGVIHSHLRVSRRRAHQPHAGGYIDEDGDNDDDDDDDANDDEGNEESAADRKAREEGQAALSAYAIGLGFHPAHVAEGLKTNFSRETLLDWLCLLVPEQDLPPKFRPQHAQFAAMKFDTESLALHRKASRLCEYGFAYAECANAVKDAAGDEVTALHVCFRQARTSPSFSCQGKSSLLFSMLHSFVHSTFFLLFLHS